MGSPPPGDIAISIALVVLATSLLCCVTFCVRSCQAQTATSNESLLPQYRSNNFGTVNDGADNVERDPDYESENDSSAPPTFSTVCRILNRVPLFSGEVSTGTSRAPDAESDTEEEGVVIGNNECLSGSCD